MEPFFRKSGIAILTYRRITHPHPARVRQTPRQEIADFFFCWRASGSGLVTWPPRQLLQCNTFPALCREGRHYIRSFVLAFDPDAFAALTKCGPNGWIRITVMRYEPLMYHRSAVAGESVHLTNRKGLWRPGNEMAIPNERPACIL